MITLKFNADKLYKDLIDECLIESANEAMESICKYILRETPRQHLTAMEKSDSSDRTIAKRTLTPASAEKAFFDNASNSISAACASYGWTVLLSFGTGIYQDLNNSELDNYINSKLYNPLRRKIRASRIVGRPKGNYNSTIGKRYSAGKMAGKTISGWRTLQEGIKPNYVIQNAEKRLERGLAEGGFVQRILERNTELFFERHPLDEYFYNVEE